MKANSKNTVKLYRLPLLSVAFLLLCACQPDKSSRPDSFTLAVIPDTQNYIDFRHQKARGFVLDGSEMFIQQMQFIARHSVGNGGDIAFVASVGDVWQHQTLSIDPEHQQRGIDIEPNPILSRRSNRAEQVIAFELPTAVEGYRIISRAGLPFGVAPGNHDYDASWSVAGFPPNRSKAFSELEPVVEDYGILHVGGLNNFRSVFGDNSEFYKDRPWYVASYMGGTSSAQKFSAGGYDFLHLALEMHAGDNVLAWAEKVLADHPGLPTIVTTHDYLNTAGERKPNPLIDLTRVDPEFHNSAEQLWDKLISRYDQIFMLLCGHQHGQSYRVDNNVNGNQVHQILADYQDRGQAGLEKGSERLIGLGDGWLRLMHFNFKNEPATITIKTYSSYFEQFSSDMETYAQWYKANEQPDLNDSEFYAADDFVIRLQGFKTRFSLAN